MSIMKELTRISIIISESQIQFMLNIRYQSNLFKSSSIEVKVITQGKHMIMIQYLISWYVGIGDFSVSYCKQCFD